MTQTGQISFYQALQETIQIVRGGRALERTVQRAAPRVPCVLPISIMGIQGSTVNVSASGLRLRLPRALVAGFNYPIVMQNSYDQNLPVEVRVVWSLSAADGIGYDAGCEYASFGELQEDDILGFFRKVSEFAETPRPQSIDVSIDGTPLIFTAPDGRVRKALATGFHKKGIEIASRVGEDAGTDVDVFVQLRFRPFRTRLRIVESKRAEDGIFFHIETEFVDPSAWKELQELI